MSNNNHQKNNINSRNSNRMDTMNSTMNSPHNNINSSKLYLNPYIGLIINRVITILKMT